jgi:hypothetical protein
MLFHQQDYSSALQLLTEIPDYKDAAEMISACRLQLARSALENDDYETAVAMLEPLEHTEETEALLRDARYDYAQALIEQGTYNEARAVLAELGDYESSRAAWRRVTYLLARQAGFNPCFAGAEQELPESSFYILCSSERDDSYTWPAQKRFFDKAKAGATVLALYCGDSRFTRLREQAGVQIDYCCRSSCERTFALSSAPDRKMHVFDKATCRLLPGEAEVLGATPSGEPMFTKFAHGKGVVLLCNAPIDRQTIDRTDVVSGERPQPYYLVFREAAKIAGVRHVVEKGDCPWVGLTEHPAADGSTIVMAINFEPRAVKCPIKVNGTIGRVWRGDVKGDAMVLAANEAALFEVKK